MERLQFSNNSVMRFLPVATFHNTRLPVFIEHYGFLTRLWCIVSESHFSHFSVGKHLVVLCKAVFSPKLSVFLVLKIVNFCSSHFSFYLESQSKYFLLSKRVTFIAFLPIFREPNICDFSHYVVDALLFKAANLKTSVSKQKGESKVVD